MFHDFHFLRPFWFFAFLPMGFLLWQRIRFIKASNTWRNVCDPHLLPHLLLANTQKERLLSLTLLSLAGSLLIFALTGPTWARQAQHVYRALASKIIIVDLSSAMLAQDIQPNRITRAKYKILDLLKNQKEGQVGMLAFSDEAYLVSPLTHDAATIAAMVPELSPNIMPAQGQNISAALKKAVALMQQAGSPRGEILLVTANSASSQLIKQAKKYRAQGYTLSVLGIGTPQGAPIPTLSGYLRDPLGNVVMSKLKVKDLKKLAQAGGGHFVKFDNQDQDLNYLLSQPSSGEFAHDDTQNLTQAWRDEGRGCLLLLLPLLALIFRKGWFESLIEA